MISPRTRKILTALLLSIVLLTTACTPKEPGRFDQAQQESSRQRSGQAVARKATQGSNFNKIFPTSADGYQRVFTQEKKGFSQAKLKKDGKDMAVLSISDTSSNPSAAAKYSNSTAKIAGYPAREIGNTSTAILVNDRYQVKISSRSPSFTASDRQNWIEKFNFSGFTRLK
ncbi:MAG: hypothetical protein QNJ36_18285 [Calothrix sp. MO_167.B42]|nr:hypothetical protein [Calothrix sp. MO_167.B42]